MPLSVLVQAGHAAWQGYPAGGGAPGEAAWTSDLANAIAGRLAAAGVACVVVGNWYGLQEPPEATDRDYGLALFLHYDAAVYGAGRNSGWFADRWRPEGVAAGARAGRPRQTAARAAAGAHPQTAADHLARLAARGWHTRFSKLGASRAGAAFGNPNAPEEERAIACLKETYGALCAGAGIPLREQRRNPNTYDYYGYRATTWATPGVLVEFGVGAPFPSGQYPAGDDAAFLHEQREGVADATATAALRFLGLDPALHWSPLDGTDLANPYQGGYHWLSWTGDTWHPGLDLNTQGGCTADRGRAILAPCNGTVRHVGYHVTSTGRGFGHHLWIEADGGGGWAHLCHLMEPPEVRAGERVLFGQPVGRCGRTAGWDCDHLHVEVSRDRPPDWGYWPQGLARPDVAARYHEPVAWLNAWYAAAGVPKAPVPIHPVDPEDEIVVVISDDDLQRYFEQLGVPVNMATAIMQRAALAHRRGETPGPAVSGEYAGPDGHVRQAFSNATLEYHPEDGQVYRVELNLERAA